MKTEHHLKALLIGFLVYNPSSRFLIKKYKHMNTNIPKSAVLVLGLVAIIGFIVFLPNNVGKSTEPDVI